MSTELHRTYLVSVLPGLCGLIAGVLITSVGHGDERLSEVYTSLPEFELWRGIIVVQIAVYTMVTAHLWESRSELDGSGLSGRQAWGVVVATVVGIGLPNRIVPLEGFPLPEQELRTVLVLVVAVVAMLLITNQLAKLHANVLTVGTIVEYRRLARVTQDLLVIAATTITLGTLGVGLLESSLSAVPEDMRYSSPLNRGHVVAYGAYFTVLLFVFFGPVFSAERAAAKRLAEAPGAQEASATGPKDGRLQMTLVERFASALGVLSPLLGALLTQLPI